MLQSLKYLRKHNGYTQEQLASAIGATKRQIGAWERGENDLPLDYAVEIADLFGCTLDDLVGADKRTNNKLTPDEAELLLTYRSLTQDSRDAVMVVAHTLAKSGH